MNRFQKKQEKTGKQRTGVLSILLAVLVVGCVWNGITVTTTRTRAQEKQSLEEAIQRDIVTCYALEGVYPESLEYLKEHYGLTYNEDRYIVNYEALGCNGDGETGYLGVKVRHA